MTEPALGSASAREDRRARIRELLRQRSDADGFLPFDRFMEVALYADGAGFYAREESPFGKEGDFYTAAHASPLFGRTIAERVRAVVLSDPGGASFRVMEVGPGDGALGEEIVRGLASEPSVQDRVEYVLVERSSTLLSRALERVPAAGREVGIPVVAAAGIGADGPFRGVVVANELLDAQPARRLVWNGERWEEGGLRWDGSGFVPATAPLAQPVPPPDLPRPSTPGAVLEVAPMAEAIVREVADHLVSGLLMVLDYGMEETELLAGHPAGTLAALRRHRAVEDPTSAPGETDLSVFVNFTRLRAVAGSSGLVELAVRRQAEALGVWGFPRLLEDAIRRSASAEEEVRVRLAAKNLLFGFDRFYAFEFTPPASAGRRSGFT